MTDSHPIVIEFFHDCLSAWCYKASERLRAFAAAHPDVQMVQRCYPLAVSPMLFNRQLYADKREAKRDVVMVHWADARAFEPDPCIIERAARGDLDGAAAQVAQHVAQRLEFISARQARCLGAPVPSTTLPP